jgi:hypothetical protein
MEAVDYNMPNIQGHQLKAQQFALLQEAAKYESNNGLSNLDLPEKPTK